MNKKLIIISIGLLLLVLGLIFGYLLEIANRTIDRIITIFFGIAIVSILIVIIKNSIDIRNKKIKVILLILITMITIPYVWIILWTSFIIKITDYPIWEDTAIFSNKKGETVISEFRETSGSIYDYRYRKILYDNKNGFRISIDWDKKRMDGLWKEYLIDKDSTGIVNMSIK